MGLFKILWNIKNLNQKGNPKYNAYEEDIAVLNLFFGDSTAFGDDDKQRIVLSFFCTEFERSLKMTWVDFMSQFGGNCGLCLGISLLSVIEIFYWFSVKLCKNFKFWDWVGFIQKTTFYPDPKSVSDISYPSAHKSLFWMAHVWNSWCLQIL